ncbi:MAG: sigma-70 family RNA polymerase sigma factor [Verrucomicrobiota bacterium]
MEPTDQDLLLRYLSDQDDGAFRQLLERHSGLVYGTAIRATHDPGTAEEIVQDVFVLLAKKARRLSSHPCVAGWLHLTSRNLARHAIRGRQRRDHKHSSFHRDSVPLADKTTNPGESTNHSHEGEQLDSAVQRLPKGDREAIILRFYEDREYAEIATLLKISEEAARKRVSRAVKRLQDTVGSPMASGGAMASLAVASPPGLAETVAASLPSAASSLSTITAASSTSTGIAALMTKQTTIILIGCAAICASLLYYGISQRQQNQKLVAEIENVQSTHQSDKASAVISNQQTASAIEKLEADLASAQQRAVDAEARAAELEALVEDLDDEVVVAYGKVEEIGNDFGSLVSEARALKQLEDAGKLDEPENRKRFADFIQSASSMTGLSQEIVKMEGNPEEGPRFFAHAYSEIFDLDPTTTARLESILQGHIKSALDQGITLKDLPRDEILKDPKNLSPKAQAWIDERASFFKTVRNDLRNAMPQPALENFDNWVEDNGIGFKNITVKGLPLSFSLSVNLPQASAP